MPRTDRLGMTVSLVVLGLALSMFVPLPPREFSLTVLGSDLTLHLSGSSQLAIVMTALVCAGVDAIMRAHPRVYGRSILYSATFWVLPSLLLMASIILLRDLSWWAYRLPVIGLTGLVLALMIVLQYRSLDQMSDQARLARLVLNVGVYIAGLVLFVALYGARLRSVISSTGILMASSMLTLELLRDTQNDTRRIWLYAALTGLLMGELTWALNYCSIDARVGGTFLLLVFYVLTGLSQQYLWDRLNRRVAIEYGIIWTVGLGMLVGLTR